MKHIFRPLGALVALVSACAAHAHPGHDTGGLFTGLLHTLADAALPLGLVAVAMLLLDSATGRAGGGRLGRLVATPARRAAAVAVLAVLVALVMAAHA
jgi:hypothetical protein